MRASMKTLLIASQAVCIASLIFSGTWRRYPLLTGSLGVQMIAAGLFSPVGAFYCWIAGPALALRFAATLEVSNRQTGRFRYWSGLTAGAVFLGLFYTASVWQNAPLNDFVSFRRALQIWCAAFFTVLQVFWVVQRFWFCSLSNWAAAWFGLSLVNHASVSLVGIMKGWTWLEWWDAMGWSWRAEALIWIGLSVTVLYLRDRDDARSFAAYP